MSTYRVTYQDGRQVDVQLDSMHAPAQVVIAEATITARDVEKNPVMAAPVTIVRDPENPAGQLVVWQRGGLRDVRMVELPEPVTEIRLFVSFAYETTRVDGKGMRTAFGSTLLDIEFEPSEPGDLSALQQQIAEYVGETAVTIIAWQKVARR